MTSQDVYNNGNTAGYMAGVQAYKNNNPLAIIPAPNAPSWTKPWESKWQEGYIAGYAKGHADTMAADYVEAGPGWPDTSTSDDYFTVPKPPLKFGRPGRTNYKAIGYEAGYKDGIASSRHADSQPPPVEPLIPVHKPYSGEAQVQWVEGWRLGYKDGYEKGYSEAYPDQSPTEDPSQDPSPSSSSSSSVLTWLGVAAALAVGGYVLFSGKKPIIG